MKECIKLFKYRGNTALAKPLSDLMAAFIDRLIIDKTFDLIIPVPIHSNKRCQRGFNQSELLSRNISKAMGIPVARDLVKTRNTRPQNVLNRNDRLSNLNDAFCVKDPRHIQKKTVLLIDDVITTCATVNECAKTLIDSGSGEVYALSLARGA